MSKCTAQPRASEIAANVLHSEKLSCKQEGGNSLTLYKHLGCGIACTRSHGVHRDDAAQLDGGQGNWKDQGSQGFRAHRNKLDR